MQEQEDKLGSGESVLYTYIDFLFAEDSISAVVKRQKREIKGETFDLIDVFNAEEGEGNENLCLICMASEPDCIIMPCRHMVVNIECAQLIDDKKDKFECPLCRAVGEELIYVKKKDAPLESPDVKIDQTLATGPSPDPIPRIIPLSANN